MPTDAEPLNLEVIKKRLALATPGPWYRIGPPWNDDQPWINAGSEDPHRKRFICDLDDISDWGDDEDDESTQGRSVTGDADFIAAARSDVPALVAEVERLRRNDATAAAGHVETLAEVEALHQEILRLKAGHADLAAMHAEAVAKLGYDPNAPLPAWEQALLDEQAKVIAAERDVIEAATAWRKEHSYFDESLETVRVLAAAVDTLPGLDRDNETPEGSDGR